MGAKEQVKDSRKRQIILLGVIGILLVLVGVAISTIHNPLRGSGLGTISAGIGVVLLVVAFLRFFNIKRK
jgi:hypothetical protein